MAAECKCDNGHCFTLRVRSYDPELNLINFDEDSEVCPECGANFEIHSLFDEFEDEL